MITTVARTLVWIPVLVATPAWARSAACPDGSPALKLARACYAGALEGVTSGLRFEPRGCAGTLVTTKDASTGPNPMFRHVAESRVDIADDVAVRTGGTARPTRGLASVDDPPVRASASDVREVARRVTTDVQDRIRSVSSAPTDAHAAALAGCADELDRYREYVRRGEAAPKSPRGSGTPQITIDRRLGRGNVPQILRRAPGARGSGPGR